MESAPPPALAPDPDEPVSLDDIVAQSNKNSDVEALDNVLNRDEVSKQSVRKVNSSTVGSKTHPLTTTQTTRLVAAACHEALLGVYAAAVLLLIAVFCTTIIWLAVLWLNARLMLLGATLLRSAMNKQSQPRIVVHVPDQTDAEVCAANLTPEPTMCEPVSQPPLQQSTHSADGEPLPGFVTDRGTLAEHRPVVGTEQISKAPQHKAPSPRTNPFGGDLTEAKEFLSVATKAQSKKKSQASPRQQLRPLRVGLPAKSTKPVAPAKIRPPVIAAPIPPLPAGFVPPHKRKALEAQARAEAEAKKQAEQVATTTGSPQPQNEGKEDLNPSVETTTSKSVPRSGKVEASGGFNNSQDQPLDRLLHQDPATFFNGASAGKSTAMATCADFIKQEALDEARAKQATTEGDTIELPTANERGKVKAIQTDPGNSQPSSGEGQLIDIDPPSFEAEPTQTKPRNVFADQVGRTRSRVLLPANARSIKPGLAASSASISQRDIDSAQMQLLRATMAAVAPSQGVATQGTKPSSSDAVSSDYNEMLARTRRTLSGFDASLHDRVQRHNNIQTAHRTSAFGSKPIAAPPGLHYTFAERQAILTALRSAVANGDRHFQPKFNEAEPSKSLVFPVRSTGTSLYGDTENAIDDGSDDDGSDDDGSENDDSKDGDSKDGDSKDDDSKDDDSEVKEKDGEKEEEDEVASPTKRKIANQKKEVRDLVKAAWIDREIVRRSVCNQWQPDDYANLARITKVYMERREELEGLMASGQLNEEDAQVYPVLHEASTAPPKRKPSYCEQMITAVKKADKAATAGMRAPPREPSKLELAQRKMASVHRARENALAAGDKARLKRCNAKYMAERRALVQIMDDMGMLNDVYEKYPPI